MGFRYIGTKTQVIDEILPKIKKVDSKNAHITDLMCGTASVSLIFKKHGFRVTAVDIMTYSYHHARVALLFKSMPRFSKAKSFILKFYKEGNNSLFEKTPYEKIIAAFNNLPLKKGYFWREFSREGIPKNGSEPRNYFSPFNAKKIDSIRYWVKKLKEEDCITELEYSLLLHNLIMATNNIANISGTYGHYLSKLSGRANDKILLKPLKILLSEKQSKHTVIQGYAEDIASMIKCDVCYIDPPYMKRQYAANYHILETLARGDNPIAVGKSGLRPWRDQYSNFCTKTKIKSSFEKIINKMDCQNFFVSYSEDGLLSFDELISLFSQFGKVETYKFKHKRFRSNKSSLSPILVEYLFYIKKK